MYEITYLRTFLLSRYYRATDEDASRGASAIEWAIITGALSLIAIAIGAFIYTQINTAAKNIKTDMPKNIPTNK